MTSPSRVIPASLWERNSPFIKLGRDAQLLHLLLRTQGDLDAGALIPMRERRWAGMSHGGTVMKIQAALAELTVTGWACGDDDVQEVFVSGVFIAERIHQQPRRAVAAWDAISRSHSQRLRAVAGAELGALIAGVEVPVPRGLRAVIFERDGYRCRECGWAPGDPVPLKPGTDRPIFRILEIDHIWPRSKGGRDEAGNFQVLCTTCNCRKGSRVTGSVACREVTR